MNKIYECIVGSHAYSTNIETSDIDIKGVYVQSVDELIGLKYQEQINPDKDTSYYELRRFIELAGSANPTMLEMLFVDPKFIKVNAPAFQHLIDNRNLFLTKQCANSFGGYAVQQIKKAKGLDKKMNWEKSKTVRQQPIDFCFIHIEGKSISVKEWLKKEGLKQEFVGLSALNRIPNCYAVFYDHSAQYGQELNKPVPPIGFRGINFEDSNDIRLSNIPKGHPCLGVIYYNKDAYSLHCKDYNSYQEWLKKSNPSRRVETQQHGQKIDGKNLMHCMRLIESGLEIARNKTFTVFRSNAKELLDIRTGKCKLEDIIYQAEVKLDMMEKFFKASDLPESLTLEQKHKLLLECRSL